MHDAPPTAETAEQRQTLWLLAASPTIWAVHFLASYLTGALWCAKFVERAGSLGGVPLVVGVYTAVALAAIGIVARIAFGRHRFGTGERPHDDDTPQDRHRFLGFAGLLLSGLSAVAVVYVALAASFFRSCL
jgi:hypothetical protein